MCMLPLHDIYFTISKYLRSPLGYIRFPCCVIHALHIVLLHFFGFLHLSVLLRHSNVNCDDDAACCQREAAIKFADQNEDGPLDLILFTGRTAPARNSKGLAEILKLTTPNEVRSHCEKDPN